MTWRGLVLAAALVAAFLLGARGALSQQVIGGLGGSCSTTGAMAAWTSASGIGCPSPQMVLTTSGSHTLVTFPSNNALGFAQGTCPSDLLMIGSDQNARAVTIGNCSGGQTPALFFANGDPANTAADLFLSRQAPGEFGMSSVTFANLGTTTVPAWTYCSDCTEGSNPCTGTGNGTYAFRISSTPKWKCL